MRQRQVRQHGRALGQVTTNSTGLPRKGNAGSGPKSCPQTDRKEADPIQEPYIQAASFSFADLPTELIQDIVDKCVLTNPTSIICCNKSLQFYAAASLYRDVHIQSLDQLRAFVSARSGAQKWGQLYTTSLRIDIPGVPGSSEVSSSASISFPSQRCTDIDLDSPINFTGVPQSASARRLLYISQALELCPHIRHLHLALFAVHHSELRISSAYRDHESSAFVRGLSNLGSIETILWTPPSAAANIQGFSVAVVEQALQSLALGIRKAACAAVRIRSLFHNDEMQLTGKVPLTLLKRVASSFNVSSWSSEAILRAAKGYGHPLRRIEVRNAMFPTRLGPLNLLSVLATPAYEAWPPGRVIPHLPLNSDLDDEGSVDHFRNILQFPHVCDPLLPNLTVIKISSATNVSAQGVGEILCRVGRQANTSVEITNGFVGSIWEPRLTLDSIQSCQVIRMRSILKQHLSFVSLRWFPTFWNAVNPFPYLLRMQGFSARILQGWWLTGRPSSVWPHVNKFWQIYLPLYLLISATKGRFGPSYRLVTPYAKAWLETLTYSSADGDDHDDASHDAADHFLGHDLDFEDTKGTRSSYRLLQRYIESQQSPLIKNKAPNEEQWRACLQRDERYRGREENVTVEKWMDDRIEKLLEKRMQGLKLNSRLDCIGGGHSRAEARGGGW